MLIEGWTVHFHTSLTHDVLHEYLGDDDDETQMCLTFLAIQLLDFHMKTPIYVYNR